MELLHGLDAVCLQKAEQRSAFLQGPDFAGADAALFHLAGGWPQMDRGNLINALPLVAAMVNALRSAGRFQRPIGVGRPRCPPNLHTFFIVPVGRILPVIFPTAFPIRDTLSYSSRSCRMMFLLPSVICTLCTGFFYLAIIKGPPNDNYFIIEGPCLDYFTEKVPQTLIFFLLHSLQLSQCLLF